MYFFTLSLSLFGNFTIFFQKNLFNSLPFSHLFAPARHSRSIVTNARNSPPPRMKREPWFCKDLYSTLALIRSDQSDSEWSHLHISDSDGGGGPNAPTGSYTALIIGRPKHLCIEIFPFDFFPQTIQLIRNPKILQWDLKDLLPLLNKSTANNFSDLCVKELYPRRVLSKNWQKKKIREPNFKTSIYSWLVDCPIQLIDTWIFIFCVPWQS